MRPTVKMTFAIPQPLAERFVRRVAPRQRSKYVAAALEQSLRRREAALVRACRLANQDPEAAAIEREMDAFEDRIEEPWDESPPR
jgi:hypothetical protein